MSVAYRAIQWNAYKKRYDLALGAMVVAYIATFFLVGRLVFRGGRSFSDEVFLLRALGTCSFILLNITIIIGPLARLDRRFLPMLYNRRHLGVLTFLLALMHGLLSIGFYHGFGVISPAVSLLTSNTQYRSLSAFPFEILGLIALVILFLMAATSHDFWLKNLSPRVWKWLHMLVYVAWALVVLHVALGVMQTRASAAYAVLLGVGIIVVPGLHIAAGLRESRRIDLCAVDDIAEGRGRVASLPNGERVALFKHKGRVCAISNGCAHQGGPLGEGRIIDGCITCPWHGYQYRPEDGCAPPPFTEKLATHPIRIEAGRVLIDPNPLPLGTRAEPVTVEHKYVESK